MRLLFVWCVVRIFFLLVSFLLALPLYSITRAYCKEVLCETFGYLLLPDDSPDSQASRDSESVLQTLKLILKLAKEANLCLLNANCSEKTVREAAGCSDSGECLLSTDLITTIIG